MVDKNEGIELAKKYKIPFLEASAKNGENVEQIFDTIAKEIKKNILDCETHE